MGAPTWKDILPDPFAALILGARGQGKTALAHRLIEEFEDDDRDAYIMGFPESKSDRLPDWIDTLPATTSMEVWPADSIVLVHEAHHLLHARRSMDAENLELDKLVTVSRHRNTSLIYDTQQSQRLDKNSVAAVDAICVRWPALMQEEFERRAVRPIIEDARSALEKYVTVHDDEDYEYVEFDTNGSDVEKLKKHVYVHADQFVGEYPHEVDLPEHWTEDISKAYGPGSGKDRGPKAKTLQDIREDMADPDDIEEKPVEEVAAIIEDAKGEAPNTDPSEVGDVGDTASGGGAAAVQTEAPSTEDTDAPAPDAGEAGREFIERMIAADNRLIQNDYGEPTVEVIVPGGMAEETAALIDEWDINPAGPDVLGQDPSFADQRPEVADDLVSYQFLLSDSEGLGTSGYDLEKIINGLEGEPFLVTAAQSVEADIPV